MTPGNMPRLALQRLVAYCLNRSCRHEGADRRVEVSRVATGSFAPNAARADALTQTYRPSCTGNVWP
jgi:hypothetical protein